MKRISSLVITVLIALNALPLFANTDVKGAKDHPLISRFPGTRIVAYNAIDYDTYQLATGPGKQHKTNYTYEVPQKTLEGKITTIIYQTNIAEESLVKIHRNYQQSLANAGFKTLFECANEACGPRLVSTVLGDTPRQGLYLMMDPWNVGNGSDFRFWNGVLTKNNKEIYLNLVIERKSFGNFPPKITVDVIETEKMQTGLVNINMDYLKNQLVSQGKVVLSGLFFDTNKAELKPESNASLNVVADYLSANKTANVFIVGHTDTVGDYAANVDLSKRRADAIVHTLTTTYGVNKARLQAIGVGPVSPVSSNANDNGKADNRRVEMVLR